MTVIAGDRLTSRRGFGQPSAARRAAAATIVCAIVLLALWAWTRGLSGPYHFDDYVTPLNDPASQELAAWWEYLPVTLRPVTKLSYALEAEAGLNREPAPRRLVSLAFHALSAALLLVLLVRLVPALGLTGAGLLAALWLIHPVHADSVLMVSGRSAVLSGMFLLAALVALERSKSWLAALLFLLACFSRETALAGLLPLLVLAAGRPGTSWRSAWRELAPTLVAMALVLAWILTTPRYLHLAEYSLLGRPFWPSLASQVGAVPVGLGLLFNPAGLSVDYGIALPGRVTDPGFALGAAGYLAAGAGVALLLRRSRAAAIGLAICLAALLPTQSVIPKLDPLTNRPLCLALAGLLLAVAPLLAVGARRLSSGRMTRARAGYGAEMPTTAGMAASAWVLILVVMLSVATARRSGLFESELGLWRDAAAKSVTNARPHLNYALWLLREGNETEAATVLDHARRIDPFSTQIAALARIHSVTGNSP